MEAFVQHFLSFWNYRHLENFHFFHYADMKHDIRFIIQQLAGILDIELPISRRDEVCEAVSFTEMKKKASTFAPASGKPIFKSDEAFFSSGKNDQWRGVLERDDLERYTNRISDLLSPDAVDWLENGNNL